MPTYRSITISLVSQFDILTIPEYAPPSTSTDPFSEVPILVDSGQSLVSVYVPTYPSSQFWLSYSISPPYPPHALFYFKLFLNNSHVVSWGCGEEDEFKGKTMFGVYCAGESRPGKVGIEKRVFCFAGENYGNGQVNGKRDRLGDVMEVRVYRARGRKRIWPELMELKEPTKKGNGQKRGAPRSGGSGVDLINAGILEDKHPKRFYKYALLDPTDQPFASFRYYYRTWEQLEALGVTSPSPEDNNDDEDANSTRTFNTRTTNSLSSHNPSPTNQRHSKADDEAKDNPDNTHPTRTNPTPTLPPSTSSPRHQSSTKLFPIPSPSPTPRSSLTEPTSLSTATGSTTSLPSRATLTPPPTAFFPLPIPISNINPALTHSPTKNTSTSTRTPTPNSTADADSSPSRFGRLLKTPSPTKGKENRGGYGSVSGSGSARRDGRAGLLLGVVASAVRRRATGGRGASTPTPTKGGLE